LSAAYLKNAKSKKDIISRLSAITNALESDPELDPSDAPGLASLSTLLVQPDSFLHHKDSDVRLHTLLACMELFYVYAPEPPWDEEEILNIFRVMVRMLGNLGHTLESSGSGVDGGGTSGNSAETSCGGNSNNYEHYFRILELLSEVKIGVVLVELVRSTPTDLDPSAEDELRQEALEILCDLIRTIITCVHVDHPPEVAAHAEVAVAACIEEFDGSVPVQVLDEILVFVGAGPIQWVTNPAAVRAAAAVALAKKKRQPPPFPQSEMPPAQIQQTNPQYLVAAKIIRRTEDKISSPIAALLNGLLGGDTDVVTSISVVDLTETTTTDARGKTVSTPSAAAVTSTGQVAHTGADVWSITYELHRIAPQILTTVIGTVASSLVYPEVGPRWRATKLLGRLFAARSSNIAVKFRICFSQWLRRSADTEQKIRETMVKGLVSFLTNKSHETDLCQDVNESLATILTKDPSLDVRLLAIRQVCELAHNATNDAISDTAATTPSTTTSNTTTPPSRTYTPDISVFSAELLLAVANRVSSKNKTERRDAITGLAQIFHKHYIRKILRHVQDGGDDCDIEVILRVLHEHCSEEQIKKYKFVVEAEEKFGWIPQKVFECVYFSDATDPELRNRIYQIVDDVLLDGGLTATSRAVGLAIILHGLKKKGKENAFKWMCALFSQRSQLQRALGLYLDARVKAKGCEAGSAEAFTADAEAMEKLEVVASLSSPLVGISSSNSDSSADMSSVLKRFHTAKDKHIFRILSTIASPTHSPSARKRAFDELPKRTKGMGAVSVAWTKALARRCSMGAFVNFESIEHCIILAQESFEANDCKVSSLFLTCVKTMIAPFPALAATKESFKNLVEFLEVVRTDVTPEAKKELEEYGIVTLISDILAKSASSMPASDVGGKGNGDDEETISIYETLRSQLLRLCKNDGTPEQARNSVHALSSLVNPVSQHLSLPSRVKKEKKEFEPLLKALVAPSRLAVPDDSMASKQKSKIVSVLSAIAAVAECAPYAFNSTGEGKTPLCWGERAIDFSLNAVLLGKNTSSNLSNEEYSSDSGSESETESPAKGRRSSTARGNKAAVASSKENDKVNISVHCRMICASIEVLICHIRATIVRAKADGAKSELEAPSTEHVAKVFKTLIDILEQNGQPPSSRNERYCKTVQDQAELRRCAATNLLRLCDANLQLENTYLTPKMWHILSATFLDKDIHARESIMEELSCMLTGSGKFRHNASSYPPSLRFVALVSLCPDGDHGAHSAANGYAANVGRRANSIKVAATQCIKSLRVTCQATAAQCRSLGREAEKNFENRLKMKLMPEYSVPYALHLLSFRHETASSGGTLPGDADDDFSEDAVVSSEASNRMLKKRLKWLFDPLIHSLGAGADNISFLLRMVELLSKCYPVDVEFKKSDDDLSIEDDLHDKEEKHASARLKIITMAARDVLLSYVKKDVNLSAYPGAIFLPGDLFKKSSSVITSPPAYQISSEDVLVEKSKTPAKAANTTGRAKRPSAEKNSGQKRKIVEPVVADTSDDDLDEESFTKHTRESGSGGSRRSLRSNKNHGRRIDSSPGVADAFGDGISPIKASPSSPVHLSSESLDESPQQPTPEPEKRPLKASRSRKDPPKSESTVSEKKLRRRPDPVLVAKRSEDDEEGEESSVESPSKKPKLHKSTEGPMDKFVKRPSRDAAKKRSSYGNNSFAKNKSKNDKKLQGKGDPIVAVERRGPKVQEDAPLDEESKISQSSEEPDEMPAKNLRNSRKKQNNGGATPTSSTSTVPASGSSKKKSRRRVDPVLSVQRSGKTSQEDAFSNEHSRTSQSSADSEKKSAKNLRNSVKIDNTGRATPKSASTTRALASNEKKSRSRVDPVLTVERSGSMSKEDAPSDDESKFSQSSAKSEEKPTKPLLSGRNKEPTRKVTPKSVSNTRASASNKRKPRRRVDPVLVVERSGMKSQEDDLSEDESESSLSSGESEKKPSKPLSNGKWNESRGQATSKSASDTPASELCGRKSRHKKDPVLDPKRGRLKSQDEHLSDGESEASQSSVESEKKPKQPQSIGKKKQHRGKVSATSVSSTPASETSEKKTRHKVDPVLVPQRGGLKSQEISLLDDQSKSESEGKPSKRLTNNQNKKQSTKRASPKSASNSPVSETSGKKSRRKVDAVLVGKRSGNKENTGIASRTKKSTKNETMDYSDDDEFDFPSDNLSSKMITSKKQAMKAAPARKAVKAKISMGSNGLSPKVSPSSASKSSTRSLRSRTRRVR